jgi:hypothetical protein
MSTPAIIYIVLVVIELLVVCAKDGDEKTGRHSAGVTLVSNALMIALLWWGGFFK